MIKKILILVLLLTINGCTMPTNIDPSTLSIEGRVLVNQKLNNEDFLVQVYKEDSNEVISNTFLDDNGQFTISIAENGNYIMTTVSTSGNDYKTNKILFSIENNKLVTKDNFTLIISEEPAQLTSSISIDTPIQIQGTVNFPNGMNYVDIKVMISNKKDSKPFKVFMIDKFGEFKISDIQDGIYYICAVGPDDQESNWLKVEVLNSKQVGEEKNILELE